jgi:hypothetical protein
MTNVLLADHFAASAVFGDFDFVALSETRHDELFTS